MSNKKIILASGSPRRKEILSQLQIPFEVVVSDVEEKFDTNLLPHEVVKYLSLLKARAVGNKYEANALIIGSDTIVCLDDQILGKPKNENDAKEMLSKLRGKQHSVFTGVAVIDNKTKEEEVVFTEGKVTMRNYSSSKIDEYIATGEPMDKAGSYAIQGIGKSLIEKYDGCYTGIVGLPICKLTDLLKKFEVQIN